MIDSSSKIKMKTLLQNDSRDKVTIAKDPSTPPNILEQLSDDENWMVRSGVAMNPSASPEVLEKLAHSKQRNIRYRVSENPSTPQEVLEWLIVDKGGTKTAAQQIEERRIYDEESRIWLEFNKISTRLESLKISESEKEELKYKNSMLWVSKRIEDLVPAGSSYYRYFINPEDNPPSYGEQCMSICDYAYSNLNELPCLIRLNSYSKKEATSK